MHGPRRVRPPSIKLARLSTPLHFQQLLELHKRFAFSVLAFIRICIALLQNACSCLNATMTARAIPSVLDPLSSSSLNKLHDPVQPPSKKRKIGPNSAAGQFATNSIIIRVRRVAVLYPYPRVTALANTITPSSRPTPLHYQTNRSSSIPSLPSPAPDSRSHGSRTRHGRVRGRGRGLTRNRAGYSSLISPRWKRICVRAPSRRSWLCGLQLPAGFTSWSA